MMIEYTNIWLIHKYLPPCSTHNIPHLTLTLAPGPCLSVSVFSLLITDPYSFSLITHHLSLITHILDRLTATTLARTQIYFPRCDVTRYKELYNHKNKQEAAMRNIRRQSALALAQAQAQALGAGAQSGAGAPVGMGAGAEENLPHGKQGRGVGAGLGGMGLTATGSPDPLAIEGFVNIRVKPPLHTRGHTHAHNTSILQPPTLFKIHPHPSRHSAYPFSTPPSPPPPPLLISSHTHLLPHNSFPPTLTPSHTPLLFFDDMTGIRRMTLPADVTITICGPSFTEQQVSTHPINTLY